ncbi:hypothetical protein PhCBS80983_g04827 [Powellomyces hirtus]|uniref:K Homology domain-containing protein n=1 Tax=Powellomyces hirtus TaxID=109895 RepID=A0A507DXW8_9FUNG|nr:hypothetical protein PhCBS80983_g04827 [Powellomyces hirtus]
MSKKPSDPPSPDRKRSLEAETSSDEDEERGGRHKRQAISLDTTTKRGTVSKTADPTSPTIRLSPTDENVQEHELLETQETTGIQSPAPAAAQTPPEAYRQPVEDKDFRMRALITSAEAGIIIGKQGRSISEIRLLSGAKVQISDHLPHAQDRILMISGMMDQISKAFSLVAAKMVRELQPGNDLPIPQRIAEVRVLVPNQLMGWFLGRQGGGKSKLKEIMMNSSAQITSAGGVLPSSTERVLIVMGVVDAIHLATYHIGTNLQSQRQDIRGFVPYQPIAIPAGYGDARGGMLPGYGAPGYFPQGQYMGHPGHHQQMQQYGYQGMGPPGTSPVPSQMVQMYIPNDMVGAVIGKSGANINEIRQASGCKIKIMSADRTSAETLVTVTGSPEANQMALYMLYSRLEAERARAHMR